jgi:cytoskeletal protein CcmA (bactofilin family)
MFWSKQHRHGVIDTLVGSNTHINGDLNFSGGCHIDGTVKGNVNAEDHSQSEISISEHGTVEGGVTVPYIIVNGIVQGDVVASQRVELGSTARVIGNIYYNLIRMAIGAEINGKLVHQPESQVPLLETTEQEPDARIRGHGIDGSS